MRMPIQVAQKLAVLIGEHGINPGTVLLEGVQHTIVQALYCYHRNRPTAGWMC